MTRRSKRREKSADPLSAIAVIRPCHVDQLEYASWIDLYLPRVSGDQLEYSTCLISLKLKGGGAQKRQKSSKKVTDPLNSFSTILRMRRFFSYNTRRSSAPSGQSSSLCPVHRHLTAFSRLFYLVLVHKAVLVSRSCWGVKMYGVRRSCWRV